MARPHRSQFVDDLPPEEVAAIERRMRDPQFSKSGFLGAGESLVARVKADAATIRKLGATHGQIADRLEAIVREAGRLAELRARTPEDVAHVLRLLQEENVCRLRQEELEGSAVVVDGRFSVTMVAYMGPQYCPFDYHWEGDSIRSCGYASVDIGIQNTRSGSSIWFSELLIHMIRDHQFFEGEGLRYRLDPREAIETLELVTGVERIG